MIWQCCIQALASQHQAHGQIHCTRACYWRGKCWPACFTAIHALRYIFGRVTSDPPVPAGAQIPEPHCSLAPWWDGRRDPRHRLSLPLTPRWCCIADLRQQSWAARPVFSVAQHLNPCQLPNADCQAFSGTHVGAVSNDDSGKLLHSHRHATWFLETYRCERKFRADKYFTILVMIHMADCAWAT